MKITEALKYHLVNYPLLYLTSASLCLYSIISEAACDTGVANLIIHLFYYTNYYYVFHNK